MLSHSQKMPPLVQLILLHRPNNSQKPFTLGLIKKNIFCNVAFYLILSFISNSKPKELN